MWDDSFDEGAANQALDKQHDDNKQSRQQDDTSRASQRQQERQGLTDSIDAASSKRRTDQANTSNQRRFSQEDNAKATDKEIADKIRELDEREKALKDAADSNATDDINSLEKQKADLQKQFSELRKRAKDEKTVADAGGKNDRPDGFDLATQSPAKSAGIFNAAAISTLQTGERSWLNELRRLRKKQQQQQKPSPKTAALNSVSKELPGGRCQRSQLMKKH